MLDSWLQDLRYARAPAAAQPASSRSPRSRRSRSASAPTRRSSPSPTRCCSRRRLAWSNPAGSSTSAARRTAAASTTARTRTTSTSARETRSSPTSTPTRSGAEPMSLGAADGAERIYGDMVSTNYFSILGTRAAHRPAVRARRRRPAGRDAVRRPQPPFLAAPVQRRSGDRRPNAPVERSALHRDRRGARRLSRHDGADHRPLGAGRRWWASSRRGAPASILTSREARVAGDGRASEAGRHGRRRRKRSWPTSRARSSRSFPTRTAARGCGSLPRRRFPATARRSRRSSRC